MPRVFASTTIRSRSVSSVPRATNSAERTRAPHSSTSSRLEPGSRRALSAMRATVREVGGDARRVARERSRLRTQLPFEGVQLALLGVEASELRFRVRDLLAGRGDLAAGALDLVRPLPSSALEVGEARLGGGELRSGARGSRLEGGPAHDEVIELLGDPDEAFAHLRRAAPNDSGAIGELADRRELARDLVVPTLQLGGVSKVLGGVGDHASSVTSPASGRSPRGW